MSMTVGLIGAGGLVGGRLAQALLARSGVQLRLGGRRPQTFAELQQQAGTRAQSVALDLADAAALAGFAQGCSLLINTAGPSTRIGASVARAALAAGADYLDPGGYDPLLAAFDGWQAELRGKGLRFVANAGLLPGLSGVLPLALARSLPGCRRLDVAYIGTDHWSYASAYDIVVSLGDFGAERPLSRIRNGEADAVPWWRASRIYRLPPPIGKVRAWSLYTEELARLARQEQIAEVRGYGVNHGPASARVLGVTKLLKRYRSEAGRERATEALMAASAQDAATHPACFAILAEGRSGIGSEAVQRSSQLLVHDTYAGTAEVAAIAAEALLQRRLAPGGYSLHEALDPDWLLDRFLRSGVAATLSGTRTPLRSPREAA